MTQIEILEQGETLVSTTTLDEFFDDNNCFEPDEVEAIRTGIETKGEYAVAGFVGCWWLLRKI